MIDLKQIRSRYAQHKNNAKSRNIPFELTFDEWYDIWQQSGHWEQRGAKKGSYVMGRHHDIGPYAVGNVSIITHGANIVEAWSGKKRGPASDKHKELNRLKQLGKKQSAETITKKIESYKKTKLQRNVFV